MELAAGHEAKRQVGPSAVPKRRAHPHGRNNTAKDDEQIPRTSPAGRETATGQAARTCPGAGPERALSEEHQPRMTRTGGASTARTSQVAQSEHGKSTEQSETRGTKTARATRRTAWVSSVATNAEAGWSREPAAPGRHGAASERRRDASETAGETPQPTCPGRREGDGRQVDGAGDNGPPPSRTALESGRPTGDGDR